MKRITLLLILLLMFSSVMSYAQTSCASPIALVPGTSQCGTNSNVGSFPDAGTAPVNPCNSSYNDGEYWYSFTGTGQALQLNVSGLTATYSGLYVLNACPASTPTCVASYSSGSSTANFTVTTPALTNGSTYYIVIANWSTPYQTNFCVASSLVAPPVPPVNDECAGAIALTVNPNFLCGTTTAGTVLNATASTQNAASCSGTEDDDVWFRFTATNTSHTIDLLNVAGSTTDMFHSLWTGTCPTLSLFGATCSDPNNSTVTGLTIGTTYYLRVYTYTATTGQNSTFNVCIGTPPPPPSNDECAGAIPLTVNPNFLCGTTTAGTTTSATASTQNAASCAGTEDDDVWFRFTATNTTHTIDLLNVAGSTTDMYHSVWTGTCPTLSLFGTACSDPNNSTVTGLTIGTTYYIRVYTYTATAGQNTTFNVCIGTPPPPPANDECAGAISLTVNPDFLCGSVTAGTTTSATASSQNAASCAGTEDDDVWFRFTATSTVHTIDLLNVAGSTTDLYHSVWTGTCPTLNLFGTACSDPNNSTVSGLTIGTTYYVRVYTYTSTVGQNTTFNICIGTPPPPPANDECSGAVALNVNPNQLCTTSTTGTIASSTASAQDPAACGGTEDDDVWYSFVANSSQHYIDIVNVTGSTTDLYHSVWTGTCPTLTLFGTTCSDPNSSTVTGLTPGTTYFVRVYSWGSTAGQTSVFDICIGSDAVPTCSDGIQNQGEGGIDCGGPCAACPPPSCIDGILNQGESGIDCGGPCAACPPVLIPTACASASLTLTAAASVSFYDDGGAGGLACADQTGGGNYCNCNCFTTTTICGSAGQYIVADFREFAMWNTTSGWDWMKIYDGPNTAGAVLYDNSSTGPDNPFGDCGIGATDMKYCSTGNCLTFQFWATSVVNRAGWDALVTSVVVPCVVPLPLNLISFNAFSMRDKVRLTWHDDQPEHVQRYTIERSYDKILWEKVSTLSSKEGTNEYFGYDVQPKDGQGFYRLESEMVDGEKKYSEVQSVQREVRTDAIFSVAPNPASSEIKIQLTQEHSNFYVEMYDLTGRVMSSTHYVEPRNTVIVSELESFPKGIHILKVIDEHGACVGRQLVAVE